MSVDTSHDGADNGAGGRFNDSLETIKARVNREREAKAKANADPSSLTAADCSHLDDSTLQGLIDRGDLLHLGVGPRRSARRR